MDPILETYDLTKAYPVGRKGFLGLSSSYMAAVDHVNLRVERGEIHGIVGESGSGKTTLARLILRLSESTSGRLVYDQKDITRIRGKELKDLRKKMQIIFQDPFSSLDPRKTLWSIITEPLKIQKVEKREFRERVISALRCVSLSVSDNFLGKYPDELSGGQRQRVGIARTLVMDPEFIVADESVSMLDASVKAGIINLLMDLKNQKQLTYLFITHELGLAYQICDRISVMLKGRIVESGPCREVMRNPFHPYTRALIDALPPLFPDPGWMTDRFFPAFVGDTNPGECGFFMRCPKMTRECCEKNFLLSDFGNGHFSACNMA